MPTPENQQQLSQDVQQSQQEQPVNEERAGSVTGYFDSTYKFQAPEQGETQQQEVQEGQTENQPSQLDELGQRLGIDPNDLGKSPEELEANQPPLPADDWYSQQFDTDEAKQFAENFKKHLGIDIKDAYKLINETAQVTQGLEGWRKQVQNERDLGILRQEFGQQFDNIMPQVAQEFQRLKQVNPQQAAALDNIDGVRYLAAYISQRQGGVTQPTRTDRTDIPQYNYPNVRQRHGGGTPPAPMIKMSDFLKWSDDEVQSRYQEIIQAKQAGTFIHDI